MNDTLKKISITIGIILGAVVLFWVSFRYFVPEKPIVREVTEEEVDDDPNSTLFVSDDAGEAWRGVSGAQLSAPRLFFDTPSDRLYIGTQKEGLWRSDSAALGRVERIVEAGGIVPPGASVFSIARHNASTPLYAALTYNERGHVVSLAGNMFRELFFAPLEDTSVRAVAVDPFVPQRLLIGSGTGVFESVDAGETWRVVHRFRREVVSITAHPHVIGSFWVTTSRGELFRTFDYGINWEELTRRFSGFRGSRDNQQLYVHVRTAALYVTSDHGLLMSFDEGNTWNDVPLIVPPDSLPVLGFAVHPTNSNILYISAANQLYKSIDGGTSWKGVRFAEKGTIISIAIDPNRSGRIVLGFAE